MINKNKIELNQKKTQLQESISYFSDSDRSSDESFKEEIKLNEKVYISSSDFSDFDSETENNSKNKIIEKKSNYAKVIYIK